MRTQDRNPQVPAILDRVRDMAYSVLTWVLQPDGRKARWWEYLLAVASAIAVVYLTS